MTRSILPAFFAIALAAGAEPPRTYGALPLSFAENQGQAPGDVRFLARGPGYRVLLSSNSGRDRRRRQRHPDDARRRRPFAPDRGSTAPLPGPLPAWPGPLPLAHQRPDLRPRSLPFRVPRNRPGFLRQRTPPGIRFHRGPRRRSARHPDRNRGIGKDVGERQWRSHPRPVASPEAAGLPDAGRHAARGLLRLPGSWPPRQFPHRLVRPHAPPGHRSRLRVLDLPRWQWMGRGLVHHGRPGRQRLCRRQHQLGRLPGDTRRGTAGAGIPRLLLVGVVLFRRLHCQAEPRGHGARIRHVPGRHGRRAAGADCGG